MGEKMATVAFGAAKWVLGKVVSKLSDHALEAWTATQGLGDNVTTLNKELLYVHSVLNCTQRRDMSGNRELVQLLEKLRELTDEADDMLDELEYFRIQDELDGTQEAADQPGDGMLRDAAFHARHAAVNVVTKWLPCLPAFDASLHGGFMDGLASAANTVGTSLLCSSCLPAVSDVGAQEPLLPAVPDPVVENLESEAPKLVFDRVGISEKMKRILGDLRPMCAQVTTLLHLELSKSNNTTPPPKRPVTTSRILEDKVFGREVIRDNIISHMIGGDEHVAAKDDLSVFLIFGHGGMGKTTLAQYVYNDERVKEYFDVKVWVCVSHDFDVKRLTCKILKGILTDLDQQDDSSPQDELDQLQTKIEKKLGSKNFLLVLDDIWKCDNDTDWKRLIAPFRKGQIKVGSTILVTSRFEALAPKIMVTDDCKIELTGIEGDDFRSYFYRCISSDKNWEPPEDELKSIGDEIIKKLKGSPLAARTVGPLLGTNLNARHWREVLESKEWEYQKDYHHIMPALKLSFDYLPFHLQECFSFCALFPEDYWFDSEDLIRFWLGAGIIYSNYYDQSKRVEDIGVESLKELVDYGFLKRDNSGYVMHDLMHDLAVQVSSHKYLSINSSNVKSTRISPLVCHLSIFIDEDVKYDEDFRKVFCELKKTLKFENLRTLIFGGYDFVFTDIFRDVFREVKGLRVLHLSNESNPPESLLYNFSKLVHLRYLRLATTQPSMSLTKALSRFYQLKVLDLLQWGGNRNLPRDMSNLRKLRHFVADEEMHSSILEVGKLKFLQELKAFNVETSNSSTFELSQLRELMELRGSLSIHNLEKVKNREEAYNAQLSSKKKLDELKLFWNLEQSNNTAVDELIESLRPHSDLERLHIEGHPGTTCPTWLGTDISVKSLESLCLYNMSWETLPPFGQLLKLKSLQLKCLATIGEFRIEGNGHTMDKSFKNLKRLELGDMPKLEKWVGGKACHLLSNLEVLIVTDCPELVELPYSQYSSSSMQDENNNWFPRLQELTIARCPNLSVLPLIPYTSTLCSVTIDKVGSCLEMLEYPAREHRLSIEQKVHPTSVLQSIDKNVLAFHNLTNLENLKVKKCPPLALQHLQMLKSLKRLEIRECERIILDMDEETNLNFQLPIEHLQIDKCGVSGKELSQLLFCLPALSCLEIGECKGLKRMGVMEEQQHQVIEEDEGLLLFPSHFSTSLRKLQMVGCSDLRLVTVSAAERAGEGRSRGLQGLRSLLSLKIRGSPNFFSGFGSLSPNCDEDMTFHCCLFPSSLQKLFLYGVEGIPSLALSNLTFLYIECFEGTMGWDEVEQVVLIHVNLNKWKVGRDSLTGWLEASEKNEPPHLLLPSSSSKPQPQVQVLQFRTEDLLGFLMAPSLCTRLSSSLQTFVVADDKVEGFTAEQEQALQLLTSLQVLELENCSELQSLPAGLHRLRNLKRLGIKGCPELRNGVAELLTQGNLMVLEVERSPNVFSADWEPSRGAVAATAVPNSSRLQELCTDDLPGFLMAPSLCSLLSSSLQKLKFSFDYEAVEGFTAEQEQALQFLTSLQYLEFTCCWKLRSLPAGLHRLHNLKRLEIWRCPELRNGLAELLTEGNLMELTVRLSPNVFSADWEPSRGAAIAIAVPNSSRLQELSTDDVPGVLRAPLCSLFSSSLQTLQFYSSNEVEGFTAEQEQALQLLTSLQCLQFDGCWKLRSLPVGLHRLRNLKRLGISFCPEIRSLPKEGLPSSLQQLDLPRGTSNELKRECMKLRNIPEIIV